MIKFFKILSSLFEAFFGSGDFWGSRTKRLTVKEKKMEIEKPLIEKKQEVEIAKIDAKIDKIEKQQEVKAVVSEKVKDLVGDAELTKFQERRIEKKTLKTAKKKAKKD